MAKREQTTDEPTFTRADYEILRRERKRLQELIGVMDKAEACGVACDTFRRMREEIDGQLAAIEMHFMTPIPS